MTIQEIQEKSASLFNQAGVEFAGVFGSFARGEAGEGSDIDIMVRFKEQKSLLQFFALQDALEDRFGRPVDLATERALHPRLRQRILSELQPIYGKQ